MADGRVTILSGHCRWTWLSALGICYPSGGPTRGALVSIFPPTPQGRFGFLLPGAICIMTTARGCAAYGNNLPGVREAPLPESSSSDFQWAC